MRVSGVLQGRLVKVLDRTRAVNGTGFVCHPDGYALTCWHVVAGWLEDRSNRQPVEGVVVQGGQECRAILLPEHSAKDADIAVLQLVRSDRDRDSPWRFLPLDPDWRVALGDRLHSFGFPVGDFHEAGIAISGKIAGLTASKVQAMEGLECLPISGLNIKNVAPGYSGAPLVNEVTHKVIGLIFAEEQRPATAQGKRQVIQGLQAFIIPLAPLFKRWPELKTQHDVFEKIRRQLGRDAREKLEGKLQAAPFIRLGLECGNIPARREAQHMPNRDSDPRVHDHGRRWESFDHKCLLPPFGHIILSSDVGTGKTTFVYWLANELVDRTRMVPVALPCAELERINPKSWEDLKQVLVDRLKCNFLEVDLKAFFEKAHKDRRLVFLFDGLDQIKGDRASVLAKIAFDVARDLPMLMASRPSAVLAIENYATLTFLRLGLLSPSDQRRYFGAHYAQAKELSAFAPELTRVPMLAYMVRDLVETGKHRLLSTRTEIYARFVHHNLFGQDTNRLLSRDVPDLAHTIHAGLRQLSYQALASTPPQIQKIDPRLYPRAAGAKFSDLTRLGLVNRILDDDDEYLLFTHQSYQEFLAAEYANEHPEVIDLVLSERWNPKWTEVIKFVAGLRGEDIVRRILAGPDSVIHTSLFLAALCAAELKVLQRDLLEPIRARLCTLANTPPFEPYALEAMSGLGKWLDEEHLREIAGLLRSSWPVAEAAAKVLVAAAARLDDWTLREVARSVLDDDSSRAATVEVLSAAAARFHDGQIREILGRLLGNLDVLWPRYDLLDAIAERLDEPLLRQIVEALRDENSDIRFCAAHALFLVEDRFDNRLVHEVAGGLRDEDWVIRRAALLALRAVAERLDAGLIGEIVALLTDKSPEVRATAVLTLGAADEWLDAGLVHKIAAMLPDKSPEVRERAVRTLGAAGERLDADLVRKIAERLRDRNPGVRSAAVDALRVAAARLDDGVVLEVAALLRHKNSGVRLAAVEALGAAAEVLDDGLMRKIAALLHKESWKGRKAAVETLGAAAKLLDDELVRKIAALMRDENWVVRKAAVEALSEVAERLDAGLVREVGALLHDKRYDVREAAVRTLGSAGEQLDDGLVREFAEELRGKNTSVRRGAYLAVRAVSRPLESALVRDIVAWTSHKDPGVRMYVLETLRHVISQLDIGLLHEIAVRLEDQNSDVRDAASRALWRAAERLDDKLVLAIAARLHDEDPRVRSFAGLTLGAAASRLDAGLLEELAALLTDVDEGLRGGAYKALEHIYRRGIPLPGIAIGC